MPNRVNRRDFLKGSAAGASALAAGLGGAAGMAATPGSENSMAQTTSNQIGRPVRVVSIGFHGGRPLEEIVQLVDEQGAQGADIIAIPEGCRGLTLKAREPLDGPTVTAMSRLARRPRARQYSRCLWLT